nr:MAG TPA: hypothetical protein [Caudoviricetes sp.]
MISPPRRKFYYFCKKTFICARLSYIQRNTAKQASDITPSS